jgi:protease-4
MFRSRVFACFAGCFLLVFLAYTLSAPQAAWAQQKTAKTKGKTAEKPAAAAAHDAAATTATKAAATMPRPQPKPIIAHLHLTGALTETPMEDPLNLTGGEITALKDLLEKLDKARRDKAVKGVILTFDGMSMGTGQLEEVRAALGKLKEAKKPVWVHAGSMGTGVYALFAGVSKLSMVPQSDLWLTGMYGESLYLKTLLDKVGIQADMMHMGAYKSAGEMLTQTGPSPEAAENMNWLFDGLYDSIVKMLADSRGKSAREIKRLIDKGPYRSEKALEAGLIDAVQFREQFLDEAYQAFGKDAVVDNRYGDKAGPQMNFSNPFAIFSIFADKSRSKKRETSDSIAIVYVDGMILPGYGQTSPFGGSTGAFSGDISKALEEAAEDESVKAVVMRVDSPGGSAEASEIILQAALAVKATKPLVVSMGNVAGSGGYYVSCGADSILADAMTITASIGVVGGKLVTTPMWDKIGVNWTPYKRGANADMLNSARPFDETQRVRWEGFLKDVYVSFKNRVEEGRGRKLKKPLEELAGGRVYTGSQALELGLVDKIGGLSDAIADAATRAHIKDYTVRVIPRPKDFITMLTESFSGEGERPSDISLRSAAKISAGFSENVGQASRLPGLVGLKVGQVSRLPGLKGGQASRLSGLVGLNVGQASRLSGLVGLNVGQASHLPTLVDLKAEQASRLPAPVDLKNPLFQSVLPMLKQLDPRRAAAMLDAVRRIELIHSEGVALLMPEEIVVY